MEGVIGYTTLFAGNFAPRNWQFCNGQILAIQSNTALFSILGTTYGGNGTTNFALPNLQGRAVIGAGQGPGLSAYSLGESGGVETTTITLAKMPAHVHPVSYTAVQEVGATPSTNVASNKTFASDGLGKSPFASTTDTSLKPYAGSITMQNAGSGQPVSIINPYYAIYYVICMYGLFPSRN